MSSSVCFYKYKLFAKIAAMKKNQKQYYNFLLVPAIGKVRLNVHRDYVLLLLD